MRKVGQQGMRKVGQRVHEKGWSVSARERMVRECMRKVGQQVHVKGWSASA